MALESFFEDGNVNIKNLTLEEQEKKSELPFNPEKEFTDSDFLEMKRRLSYCRHENKWTDLFVGATNAKILFPERAHELYLVDLDQIARNEAERELLEFLVQGDFSNFFEQALEMRTLFPGKNWEQRFRRGGWQKITEWFVAIRENGSWEEISRQAMKIKLLYPNKIKSLDLGEAEWEKMQELIKNFFRVQDWWAFAAHAMRTKIIFPEKNSEWDIPKEAWDGMKSELEACRKNNDWENFSDLAMEMKLLTADEVKMTDNGLEIIMQKNKREKPEIIPPLPGTRNY